MLKDTTTTKPFYGTSKSYLKDKKLHQYLFCYDFGLVGDSLKAKRDTNFLSRRNNALHKRSLFLSIKLLTKTPLVSS